MAININEKGKELARRAWDQACMEADLLDSQGATPGDFFAPILIEMVVLECSRVAKLEMKDNRVCDAIENHFGVEQ